MSNVRDRFPELVRRHSLHPGRLVHVGARDGHEVFAYDQAGFADLVLIEPAPERVLRLRRRFPGARVIQAACSDREGRADLMTQSNGPLRDVALMRLDVAAPLSRAAVVDTPGHERAVLAAAPWLTLDVVIVRTTARRGEATGVSPYDLVTEIVTTKGFVEVDRWTRPDSGDVDVVFIDGDLIN